MAYMNLCGRQLTSVYSREPVDRSFARTLVRSIATRGDYLRKDEIRLQWHENCQKSLGACCGLFRSRLLNQKRRTAPPSMIKPMPTIKGLHVDLSCDTVGVRACNDR